MRSSTSSLSSELVIRATWIVLQEKSLIDTVLYSKLMRLTYQWIGTKAIGQHHTLAICIVLIIIAFRRGSAAYSKSLVTISLWCSANKLMN